MASESSVLVELLRQHGEKLDRLDEAVADLREKVGDLKATARFWGITSGLFTGLGSTLLGLFLPRAFK